jgi:hypothetical protein
MVGILSTKCIGVFIAFVLVVEQQQANIVPSHASTSTPSTPYEYALLGSSLLRVLLVVLSTWSIITVLSTVTNRYE